jgi:YidC/Oxa1 family membrane protein insertase
VGNPLNALYEAVGWVLTRIYDVLKPVFGASSGWTWALTIIILVVLMRLVMVPLFIKQMHTTRAMTSLQPQMAALRKKYKNDKQTLNQEMMKLYQEAGVNPLMGCLPVVAQLPLFFSLFSVLRAIAEYTGGTPKYNLPIAMVQSAKQAKILGVSIADKVLFTGTVHVPLHAKIVIVAAVLISMATTYLTVRQSMKRGMMPTASPDNPMGNSQKYMAYIMPFFALTGLYWPFGLVLYWVTTNVWTLIQQWALFKRYPYTPPSADGTVAATAGAAGTVGARALAPNKPTVKTTVVKSSAAKGSGPTAKTDTKAGSSSGQNGTGPSANGSSRAKPGAGSSTDGGSGGRSGGSGSTSGGSGSAMKRRLGRGRAEQPQQPEPAEVKLVRQQKQRQSRSKRSGKR